MLKLPQGTENVIFDVIRRRYVALTPGRMGAAALRPLSSAHKGHRRRYGK